MPSITLKIDVDTYRGSREGVLRLIRLLKQYQANATFLFSLGPDHTGWALRRAFKAGFFNKVARTSVVQHYGIKTLMYGVLLPAPDIGLTCAPYLRAVADASFECGIHVWDHVVWQDNVRRRDAAWTQKHMRKAAQRFDNLFGFSAKTHGAAGWQMNPHAFVELDNLGIRYSSDTRAELNEDGSLIEASIGPYRLSLSQNNLDRTLNCIQLPTTLPTLDELLGRQIGPKVIDLNNIAKHILKLTKEPRDHVFTLHAELEGQKLAPIFEELLVGWKAQGYQYQSMANYAKRLDPALLPVRALRWGKLPGRSGELLVA